MHTKYAMGYHITRMSRSVNRRSIVTMQNRRTTELKAQLSQLIPHRSQLMRGAISGGGWRERCGCSGKRATLVALTGGA